MTDIVYENDDVRVLVDYRDDEDQFTFVWHAGRSFSTAIGPVKWADLVDMIHFAIYPLGGDRTTTHADVAGLPRYLADKTMPEPS